MSLPDSSGSAPQLYDWVAAQARQTRLVESERADSSGAAFLRCVTGLLSSLCREAPPLKGDQPFFFDRFGLRSRLARSSFADLDDAGAARIFRIERGGRIGAPRADWGPLLLEHARLLADLTSVEAGGSHLPDLTRLRAGDLESAVPTGIADPANFRFSYDACWHGRAHDAESYLAWSWVSLLDMVVPLVDGTPAYPDAVSVGGRSVPLPIVAAQMPMVDGDRVEQAKHARRQPLHSIAATEPRIALLARQWGLLSGFLKVERHAEGARSEASIDGFALRDLEDWTIPSSGHPAEVYEYLARVCNVACKFCYLFGNPDQLAVARGKAVISRDEMATRLRFHRPERGTTLFSAQWEINEFLVDPKLGGVLRHLRSQSCEPFYFITNGSPLKPSIIDILHEFRPVQLMISINTIEDGRRAEVMQENENQTAIARASLERLAAAQIPFAISLAAFPDFGLDELERTIRSAEALGAALVRINLPGFTRQAPYRSEVDLDTYWPEVRDWVRRLRAEVTVPLLLIPSAFDCNPADPLEPRALGAIPGSPIAAAGLRAGDVVRAIDGMAIATRSELQSLLLMKRGAFALDIDRDGRPLKLAVDTLRRPEYPWDGHVLCKYLFPWGLALAPSLSRFDAMHVADVVEESGARDCWILTSDIMRPMAEALLESYAPSVRARVRLVPIRNRFLGGNIQIMDMATIGDMADTVARESESSGRRPDLVMLAQTAFNVEGRDLRGRHWGDLERAIGVPVRLIGTTRFAY
ncbi:radical SAM protein [uncultured Methylobacterium sp.]|jgi:hypothetical protein|uniref:radical SAM protein n=1 Tax=uncultured Methylobacterium sp. TaxID=157278 RepID=UPI002607EC46|nr:radical SAM protein [uncultured Methylobacterium sp.]